MIVIDGRNAIPVARRCARHERPFGAQQSAQREFGFDAARGIGLHARGCGMRQHHGGGGLRMYPARQRYDAILDKRLEAIRGEVKATWQAGIVGEHDA